MQVVLGAGVRSWRCRSSGPTPWTLSQALSTVAQDISNSSGAASTGAASTSAPEATQHPVKSRYLRLVEGGALRHDAEQWQVVQRLAHMYDELSSYGSASQQYEALLQQYNLRKHHRLQQLEAEDAAADQQQQQQQQPAQQPQQPQQASQGWAASVLSALGLQSSAPGATRSGPKPLTPEQRAKLAAVARNTRVLREIGPPPAPPKPPKGKRQADGEQKGAKGSDGGSISEKAGLYLWGSVGSGKSLLMDLFYNALASSPPAGLKHHRRLHFNAAMLEVHSRLHRYDQQQRQARLQRMQAATGGLDDEEQRRREEEEEEEEQERRAEEAQRGQGAAAELPPHDQRGLFRYWLDSESHRQREAKAAVLAVRRHLRLARSGRISPEALAKANSAQMHQLAREFLASMMAPAAGSSSSSDGGGGSGGSGLGDNAAVAAVHTPAVLCFDEMQVADVFSAVALKGLMEGLTAAGCVVVTTSNRTPRQLPRHGLHENMFEHLIKTLESCCDVVQLSSKEDYRRLLMQGALTAAPTQGAAEALVAAWQLPQSPAHHANLDNTSTQASAAGTAGWPGGQLLGTFLHPLGPPVHRQLESAWQQLTAAAAQPPAPAVVPVMFGRQLDVPAACGGVARFRFADLCARPLGPADYVALAAAFHTVFITEVPVMSMQVRDQARRFITLIDELYNARVRLVCSAAAPPDQLFRGGLGTGEEPLVDLEQLMFETAVEGSKLRTNLMEDGGVAPVASTRARALEAAAELGGAEESFAFSRAVSRLHEMQSPLYLAISAISRKWAA